jgi:hypothetical protein
MSLETAAGLSTASIATLTLMFGVVQYCRDVHVHPSHAQL